MRKNRKSDAPYVYNDREAEIVAAIKYSRCPLCFLAHPDAHLLPTQQQNELFKSIRICHTFIENPRVFPLHCDNHVHMAL